jgi:hypothetical protein
MLIKTTGQINEAMYASNSNPTLLDHIYSQSAHLNDKTSLSLQQAIMCTLFVEYYNCSNPNGKCINSSDKILCPEKKRGENCGHNTPKLEYAAGGYLLVETPAEGLCPIHKERGR